jgi:riboflavin kinase / FMN adenylyltransferase
MSITKNIVISGEVIKGRQEGRKIGFPTANIEAIGVSNLETILPKGVWATRIKVEGKWHKSACSYGPAPVYNIEQTILEVHILDFDKDIYGQIVEVEFLGKIRDICNFDSIEMLIEQIQKDCEVSRNYS